MSDIREDLRLRRGALDHWKLLAMETACGDRGVLGIIRVWDHAAGYHRKGILSGMSDEALEAVARWNGEPGKLISTALRVRLLEGEPGARSVHGWQEAQPYLFGYDEFMEQAREAGRRGGLVAAEGRRSKGTLNPTLNSVGRGGSTTMPSLPSVPTEEEGSLSPPAAPECRSEADSRDQSPSPASPEQRGALLAGFLSRPPPPAPPKPLRKTSRG